MRSGYFLSLIAALLLVVTALLLHSRLATVHWIANDRPGIRQIVRSLDLTDLALWTEARYARHPALADYFTPFQDFPASYEHFPAGSIIAPRIPDVETSIRLIKHSAGTAQ